MTQYRIGIDVGGTFTDIVALTDKRLVRRKVRSTPDDFSAAVLQGLELVLGDQSATGDQVREVIHGTTVASNAIIEKKGARTGLLTTRGFRDVLEIGRLRTPRLYDLTWRKPEPLVQRELRQEVTERVTTDGTVYQPLDEEDAREKVERLVANGVDSIAVCYINSFANPEHERRTGEILRAMAPGVSFSLSHQVLPELREYERTSTTVINAYVRPLVDRYLAGLEQGLLTRGVEAPLLIMQSSGGITSSKLAREKPVHIVESGPVAGVMGALHLGNRIGHRSMISFDMGGTTAKAATIESGEVALHSEYEVGGEMTMGHHLLKGGGYMLRVPSIELAEVGSGGGSIAWRDPGGVLQVGPRSAGAIPGPACYGTGGSEPTVTDANVVLGYLNPDQLVGGDLSLDAAACHRVIQDSIARDMGSDVVQAAFGIYLVANSRMIRAINAVTREKGRNPADFAMCAFGGSGPVHAVAMARELGISRVIVPPAPGVFSSLGLLFTDVEHHYVQTFWREQAGLDLAEAETVHHTDIGGRVAGGNASDSTEIYQEGLRLPPVKLIDRGEPNEGLFRIIEKNVRVPDKVLGDLQAQISACGIGERGLQELAQRYGADQLDDLFSRLLDYTEDLTRRAIRGLPEGQWEFTDHIDNEGVSEDPVNIHVKIIKEEDTVTADYRGTSPQTRGAINSTLSYTTSITYACVKSVLGAEIPNNAGFFRPISVIADPDTFVRPSPPAPVAARGLAAMRITETLFGAFSKMLPDRIFACGVGLDTGVTIAGYHRDGKPFVVLEFLYVSWGGGPDRDGIDACSLPHSNYSNAPVEVVEAEQPIMILDYGFVPDGTGAGKYRGGLAMTRKYRIMADEATLQLRSDRRKFLPYGLWGGKEGTPSLNVLNPGTPDEEEMPSKFLRVLKRGEVFHHRTAGAAGWGDPLEREPELVLQGVRNEKLTGEYARREYGVVLSRDGGLTVDWESTERLRQEMRAHSGPAG